MKKFLSMILALAMILALSTTAFAAETDTKITIESTNVGTTGNRTYSAYKLLNLKTSHKDAAEHGIVCPVEAGTDTKHADECYNYAYTVNEKYRDILKQEVFTNATDNFWIEVQTAKPTTWEGVSDITILDYLSKMTSDGGTTYGTLRVVADRVYRAILDTTPAFNVDATLATGTTENVEQGYWLVADTTAGLENYDANSLVMLDTKADTEIVLTPKSALPVVEKKVKDLNDSEHLNSLDHDWVDSGDYDIGDRVPFKLTATLPTNVASYETYKMVFHDHMAAGLTLDPSSFQIFLYNTKNVADSDNDLDNGTLLWTPATDTATDNFEVVENPTDGCSFEVVVKNANEIAGAQAGNAIAVVYKAVLNENAVPGKTGNQNKVKLEFSNDPYSEATGETAEDTVVVFTYNLVINKVDNHNHALKGAGFTLSKWSKEANDFVDVGVELKGTDMTTFVWKGLDDGDYKLVETTVPDGYNKMADITFTITAIHHDGDAPYLQEFKSEIMGNGDMTDYTDGTDVTVGAITKDIVNNTGTVLPSTGAQGTFMLIFGGTMLVIVAAVFMITRKKMSVYED